MIYAGIDAGSRTIKVTLLDSTKQSPVASGVADQGVHQEERARELYAEVLHDAGVSEGQVETLVATGYGRHALGFATRAITEITCHARGVNHLMPSARTVIDIGGQDSKIILLDSDGRVQDFMMNDRCAAGTGCFLEVVARKLEHPLDGLGDLCRSSRAPASISSMCVVFAETEIIGLLSAGTPPADIAAGVQAAIVTRVASMGGLSITPPVAFTGGVAAVPGMRTALQVALQCDVTVPPDPRLTGALGAALLAAG